MGRDRLPRRSLRSQRIQFSLHLLQARHSAFESVTVKTIQAKLLNPVAYVAVCKPFVVSAFSAALCGGMRDCLPGFAVA